MNPVTPKYLAIFADPEDAVHAYNFPVLKINELVRLAKPYQC